MKKFVYLFVLSGAVFFSIFSNTFAEDIKKEVNPVNAYFFYSINCPHCANESVFLNKMINKYSNLRVYPYEIYYNRDNSKKMQEVAKYLDTEVFGVPFLVIGDSHFVGFSEEYSPVEIEAEIKRYSLIKYEDEVAKILGLDINKDRSSSIISHTVDDSKEDNISKSENNNEEDILIKGEDEKVNTSERIIDLPFLGKTKINSLSIPVLAVFMGFLDGFNPCAMWTLLFLISLLLGFKDRKRMWILGTTFIIASAFVYFLFMSAWLNLVLFLGVIIWVRLLIGGLAIWGGGFSINKFFKNKAGTCEITGEEKKQKVFEKIKDITKKNNLWIALGGIIILAFMVNLVELICSAGLPAVFTQVLAMNNLSTVSYYGYILLYIFFFMIDDLVVFFIAMFTLKMTGVTTKYARYSHLIGGALMLIIGILLIFKPGWLMFG